MEKCDCIKTGLVLEGGAMRGLFTAGVLDVLMEHDITFDGAIGVSAGAAFGCNIKSRQIGRVLRYNTTYCKDWRYASFRSLFLTGDLYGAKFDYDMIPHKLDVWDAKTFANNPMEFYCVTTNVKDGKALYHKCTDGEEKDLTWIRGSASMPVVSRPVQVDGYEVLDGGISDSIPLQYFESIGYNRNVVVLTQPATYRKQPFSKKYAMFLKTALRGKDALSDTILCRYKVYNEQVKYVKQKEETGDVFVIQPPENLNIHSVCHDPDELRRVYEIGRKQAESQLDGLQRFLKKEEMK